MWKTFQHDNHLYMIKIVQNEDLELYLTDLQSIWTQNISKESLLQHFQDSNPLFDIKIEEAASEVINLVNHISESLGLDIATNNDELELTIKSVKSEFKIQFKFKFHKATSEVFLKEVTVPLIQTVKHLEERQNMLSNLVQKKDRELEEYKLEKGVISREDLVTEKFDETTMDTIVDKSMINVFGRSKPFWDRFVQQHGNIETKIQEVQKDPWNHIKRKRKVYSSKTAIKKGKGINYNRSE